MGLSIVIAEFAIGRKTQLSPVGAFEKLAPGTAWKYAGFLGVASAFVILSFYGVVGGWILKYVGDSISGGFSQLAGNPDASSAIFGTFIESTWSPLFYQIFFMSLCMWVIINGVKGGIEKWSSIMMPLIIVLLAVLAVRGITLDAINEHPLNKNKLHTNIIFIFFIIINKRFSIPNPSIHLRFHLLM